MIESELNKALNDATEKITELTKENRKLKIEIGGLMGERDGLQMVVDRLHKDIEDMDKADMQHISAIQDLENQIKNLNEKLKRKEGIIANLRDNKETLELWLDNKEKLNEEYRKQIDALKIHNEAFDKYWDFEKQELADSLYDANKTIKKLKAELDKRQQGKYRYFGNDGESDLYEYVGDDELIYEEGLYD